MDNQVAGQRPENPIGKMPPFQYPLHLHSQGQSASDLVKGFLLSPKPCMIGRFGNNELNAVLAYLDLQARGKNTAFPIKYVKNLIENHRWPQQNKFKMSNNAGFFPADAQHLCRFAEKMIADMAQVDVLGSWLKGEQRVAEYFPQARLVPLKDLEPYYHDDPWSQALEGKKVLVVHPFEESIKRQYRNRTKLFGEKRILPYFELTTLKAIQSSRDTLARFPTWFEALECMCGEIDRTDFDVAIIGAGAYGFPLAAHVKRMGKKAVHLGGATQILFGIRGARWDERPFFQSLINEHWVRPLPEETPKGYQNVESGAYW